MIVALGAANAGAEKRLRRRGDDLRALGLSVFADRHDVVADGGIVGDRAGRGQHVAGRFRPRVDWPRPAREAIHETRERP